MKDVADDLALIVRNAIAYIKELERQIHESRRAAEPVQEPVAMLWQHRETGRTRVLMPNERTATDVAAAWDVVGPLYLAPPQRPAEPVQEPVCAHGVGKTKCSFCSVEDKQPVQEPVAGRAFLERILAAMEGVIDVADRKTDEFDALRSCVIDLTLMLHTAPPQRPAEPVQEPVAWLIEYENDEREVRFVAGTRGMRQTPLYTAR